MKTQMPSISCDIINAVIQVVSEVVGRSEASETLRELVVAAGGFVVVATAGIRGGPDRGRHAALFGIDFKRRESATESRPPRSRSDQLHQGCDFGQETGSKAMTRALWKTKFRRTGFLQRTCRRAALKLTLQDKKLG